MSGVLRGGAVAAVVLAAMALGRAVTDLSEDSDFADQPFVATADVGETVDLGYAEVTITGVRSAWRLSHNYQTAQAAGRFLLVDVEVLSTRESTPFLGHHVTDRQGRRFETETRTTCPITLAPPVGSRWEATFCYEVPRDALEGATFSFARSPFQPDDSGVRRDSVLEVDLGIDAERAEQLWDTEEMVDAIADGPVGAAS